MLLADIKTIYNKTNKTTTIYSLHLEKIFKDLVKDVTKNVIAVSVDYRYNGFIYIK